MGGPEDPLGETGQSLRLLLVPLEVLAQQLSERAKRLLLEREPLRLERALGDGRLKVAAGARQNLQRKTAINLSHLGLSVKRSWKAGGSFRSAHSRFPKAPARLQLFSALRPRLLKVNTLGPQQLTLTFNLQKSEETTKKAASERS